MLQEWGNRILSRGSREAFQRKCCLTSSHLSVLDSHCCPNKSPQTEWLRNTHLLLPSFLGQKVLYRSHWAKVKVLTVLHCFLEVLGKYLLCCFFWLLEAPTPFESWSPSSILNAAKSHISDYYLLVTPLPDHSSERTYRSCLLKVLKLSHLQIPFAL